MLKRVVLYGAAGLAVILVLLTAIGLVYRPEPGPFRLPRQRLVLDGRPLSYHQVGPPPGPGVAEVVLLHGGMGSAEDFEPLLPLLADRVRLTVVDRPGFGFSRAAGDDPTYAGNARRVRELIRALGLRRPLLVGHSHGGGVALRLLSAPSEPADELAGAVLLAPAAFPSGRAPPLDHLLAVPVLGEGVAAVAGPIVGPGLIRRILRTTLGPDLRTVGDGFLEERVRRFRHPHSLAVHARQSVTDNPGLAEQAARYGQIRSPVVVVKCDGDPTEGPLIDSPRLAQAVPGARLVPLTGCGHYIQFGQPQAVAALIREVALREAAR